MDICRISEILDGDNRPILAYFQNGRLKDIEADNIAPVILENRHKKEDRLIAIATDSYVYSGVPNSDVDSELFDTYIAVRNKKTNKVQIVAVDKVTLATVHKSKLVEEREDVKVNKDEKYRLASELGKTFGSKKLIRTIEQRERINVSIDTVREKLNETIAETVINAAEIVQPKIEDQVTAHEYLPPIHRDATTVDGVYILEEFITNAELKTLETKAKTYLSGQYKDIDCSNLYIKEEIAKLQSVSCTQSESTKILKCCVWLYAECICNFMSLTARKIANKTYKPCPYSEVISKKIFDTFSLNPAIGGRTRPNYMKDKYLCYVLVLALLVSEKRIVDLEVFAASFRSISLIKVKQIARAIGAQPASGSTGAKDLYTLKLPLPPILLPSKGKSRRKTIG